VHVVVVDPGVGGARQSVIARVPIRNDAGDGTGMQLYVGPDNGVFVYLPIDRAWQIDMTKVAPSPSPTFHGRDVFAHAAAALANGRDLPYGPEVTLAGSLPWGRRESGSGRVVHVDHFGNLITDLPAHEVAGAVIVDDKEVRSLRDLLRAGAFDERLADGHGTARPVARTYEEVEPGELVVYVGSARTIEIGVRDGRADEVVGASRGDTIVRCAPAEPVPRGPYR
jgi:S-adenosyl-L-methionine hydrolase (adenosine-forming)